MSEKQDSGKHCTCDRNQRRYCIHYHDKTGRCTIAPQKTWQEQRRP